MQILEGEKRITPPRPSPQGEGEWGRRGAEGGISDPPCMADTKAEMPNEEGRRNNPTPTLPTRGGGEEGGRKCRGGLLQDAGAAAFELVCGGSNREKKGDAETEKEHISARFGGFVRGVDMVHRYRKVLRPVGGGAGMPLLTSP